MNDIVSLRLGAVELMTPLAALAVHTESKRARARRESAIPVTFTRRFLSLSSRADEIPLNSLTPVESAILLEV